MADLDTSETRRRFGKIKRAVARLVDLSPAERSKVLDEEFAHDETLRTEVESLLAYTGEIRLEKGLSGTHAGPYLLEERIGRGGMGDVYRGVRADGAFTKQVAVKVVSRARANPQTLRRFEGERQILADLEHPNVARLLDGGSLPDGTPYFVMEHVQGHTLADELTGGPLSVERVLELAARLASALSAIHERGLVFRDVKPSNVMLTESGDVKLVDFGIAKSIGPSESEPLTGPGVIVGSPRYMSPEQALGYEVDSRSDVFAFGVVLFEALAGRLPFQGDTRHSYVSNLIAANTRSLPTDIPGGLARLVDSCLQREPDARPSSGAQLVEALERNSDPAVAARRRAALAALVALGAALLVLWASWRW